MSRPLSEQRAEFVVDDAVAYFNTAGLSPMLRTVREAAERALDRRSMPWTITAQEWFADVEALRERVARALHDAGAVFIVDASQSLGALPLDVAALRPDAVVAVGYKWLLGPLGLGYLYLDPKFHDGEPLEENWIARVGAEDFSRLI